MKKIISLILVMTLCIGLIPSGLVFADGRQSVDNGYIMVTSSADGSAFGINTLKGIPAKRFDDNKPLLYDGDDKFATSYTTVRIVKNPNGTNQKIRDYVYGSSKGTMTTLPFTYQLDSERDVIESVWTVDGVAVKQQLIVNKNTASAHGGYVNIKYTYENSNAESVGVGVRILLDTKIADNDAGQFYKNGGTAPITKETEFNGANVPEWYSISDSTTYSTTTAYGLLKHDSMQRLPDTLQLAHWYNLANTLWDYDVNSSLNFDDYYNEYQYPDSAVSIRFNPELVNSGANGSVDTMYGIGELNGMESTSDYCVMTVTQKELLKANSDNTGYENNGEITLYVTVDNSDPDSKQIVDGQLKLVFEDKLLDNELNMIQEPALWVPTEKEEDETISVGTINRGEIKRNIPVTLKARPVYEKNKNNKDEDAPDIVYAPREGYTLRKSIDTRKITFQLTGNGTPIPSVASKIVTLPSLGGTSVDVGFTGIDPKIIYYEGYSYFSIQGAGDNFNTLTDKSNWTAYLKNIVTGERISIDSFNCSVDTENKQLGLLVDMGGRLGEFELTVEFKSNLAHLDARVFSDANDHIITSADPKYKNRGYSLAVIARTNDKRNYEMRLFTAEAGQKPIEDQFKDYKEELEKAKGEVLMEGRGVFKVLYREGKSAETSTNSNLVISTDAATTNKDIMGFETIPGSDNIKLNRILYYNSMTPLTFKADFSGDTPTVMRVEGDGDLSIINASTIWKHKFMIRMVLSDLYTYEEGDEEGGLSGTTAPQLQLLGGGWLLQNMGGFIFNLNYGELGCQDGRYTINFSGSVSFPLGMNKDDKEPVQSEGNTSTGETPTETTQQAAASPQEQQRWKWARAQGSSSWQSARPSAGAGQESGSSGSESGSSSGGETTNNAAAAESNSKKLFKEGNSATNSLGSFGDGGSLGISVDSILFGEHEGRDDDSKIVTGFVGLAANVEIELPSSVFPAGGSQNNDSTISEGASRANPVSNPIVSAGNHRATTAEGQNQNALNARGKNKGQMNGFSMGASVNTYEFNAGVDLGIGIGPISSAFRMSLGETNNGKICLDSIYLEIKGFDIPIVPGVSSLKGLGGGISDLASSINYKGDARPPVTVSVMAVFDLVKVMVMQADMSISGNGLTFSITGAPAGFDQIKFVAKGEFDWTTGFSMKLSGTVDLFSGIVLGNVTLALTTKPEFFMMGKISGSLNIPGLGKLAGVTLVITNKFIAGGVKILIFSGGFVYYYDSNTFRLLRGSEIDEIEEIDLDSPEMPSASGSGGGTGSHSARRAARFLEVMEVPDEEGHIQLMGIGSGAEVVGSTVDSFVSTSYHAPLSLNSTTSLTTEVTNDMIEGKDVVLRVYYESDTAPELKVRKPDGNEYSVIPYDYNLTQDENNAAGANMLLSEKEDQDTGKTKKYAYINLANSALTPGSWQVESTNGIAISDYTVLTIPTVEPKLSIGSADVTGTTLNVSWEADKDAKVSVALVPCNDDGTPVIESFTDNEGNLVQNEHPGYIVAGNEKGSGTKNIPLEIPSGQYIVRIDSILNNSMFKSAYTQNPMQYVNPKTLKVPENFRAWAGGDGRIDVFSDVPEHATGIQFKVYKKLSNGSLELLPAIGGYVGDTEKQGSITSYFKGSNTIVDENGVPQKTSSIVPGETYYVEAYAVNTNEGSGYFSSPIVRSEEVTVPVPTPPEADVTIVSYDAKNRTDSKNIAYLQARSSNVLIEYDIKNFGTAPNDEVTVRFDIDEKQYGSELVNNSATGGKGYAAFELSDGDHIVEVVFINKAGDVTVETKKFSVDTIPADIKIEYPQNGSFFDPSVGIPIRLTTDDSVTIDVYLDQNQVVAGRYIKNADGLFEETIKVPNPAYSHEVRIIAADKNGNKTEHLAVVVNKSVAQIGGIRIKGAQTENSNTTELTAVGLGADGKELGVAIEKSKLKWTLLSDPSEASLIDSSGNNSAVVMQNGTAPFVVQAQWDLGGGAYFTDIYDSGIVGAQNQSSSGGHSGKGGATNRNTLPEEVQKLIEEIKASMSSGAEVNPYKMYADIDSVSKQSGNTVFAAGKDIEKETYLVMGTDANTSGYEKGLPEGGKFRSDIMQIATTSELKKLLIDLEVTGEGTSENLGIYKYSESAEKWIYIGESYHEARNMMSVNAVGNGRYAVIENPKMAVIDFVDIDGNWAELYINSLAYIGLIDGYVEDGIRYFKPGNEITRGELVKMLVSAKGITLDGADVSMFADADSMEDWVKPYAAAAYKAGWLMGSKTQRGIEANLSEQVTRQDAMTLVCRVLFENQPSSGEIGFADSSNVSEYAEDAVSYLTENGIVAGFEDGRLRPLDFLLREQIVKILWMSMLK